MAKPNSVKRIPRRFYDEYSYDNIYCFVKLNRKRYLVRYEDITRVLEEKLGPGVAVLSSALEVWGTLKSKQFID